MKIYWPVFVLATIAAIFAAGPKPLALRAAFPASQRLAANDETTLLDAFAKILPIDAHVHIYKADPELLSFFERLHMRAINICLIDHRDPDFKSLEPQRSEVLAVRHTTRGRAAFATTFDPYGFEQPGFTARTIRQIDDDFAHGAVAVKIYKVMGMEMKNKAGKWVMADDPAFAPIYRDIAKHNRTVIAHLAEPDSCWQAPDPASPDFSYYKEHPDEYAYAHPDWPRKEAILAARDHLLEQNPNLRVVGAHLGSMETNVDDIARRLDRFPHFAVDMAARVPYFMLQPREKVRAFLLKYQERVLYATDGGLSAEAKTETALAELRQTYARDWKYFSTHERVEYMGHSYEGLDLPLPVLRKLFHENAVRWFPGLVSEHL